MTTTAKRMRTLLPHRLAERIRIIAPTAPTARANVITLAVIATAFLIENASHLIRVYAPAHEVIAECVTLVAILTVLAPALYLIFRFKGAILLKGAILSSCVLFVFLQTLNITARIPVFDNVPVLSQSSPWFGTAHWFSLVSGWILILSALYLALVETVFVKSRLIDERKNLVNEVIERQRAEAALVEQENLYRRAISQAGAFPYRINWTTGTFTFLEDDVYRFTGYTPEELTLETVMKLPVETRMLGPLSGLSTKEAGERVDSGEIQNWRAECRIITKDGSERWISDSSVEIVDPARGIRESVGLYVDITDRKREEEALGRNERYFRALIENASDLITVVTSAGVVRYQSPSSERVLGYPPEEFIGSCIFDYLHPEDCERVRGAFATTLSTHETRVPVTLRFRHKDGSWRTLESNGRDLTHDPAVMGVVINSRDVTERVALEQQLLQAQKMEGIGRLAGGVAHDFNNLLTCILGYGELATGTSDVDPRLRSQIEQMLEAARRASDLTRQLLAFARKQVVEPQDTDLNALALNLNKMLLRLIGEDIELITLPSLTPPIVRIDPGQFEQVIVNLAVNARDAMPHGGQLTIQIDVVELDDTSLKYHAEAKPGRYVVLQVSDTGAGMSEDVKARAFEPFFTTKDSSKGTGLGLATCYGVVKQAGGHIDIVSEPGAGATFRIYLPRVARAVTTLPTQVTFDRIYDGAETILLVEDDPFVREITGITLTELGYHVLEAQDGASALALARTHADPIHLLLTDVVLPQMSGRQVADRFAKEHAGAKVMFMSGYAEEAITGHGGIDQNAPFLAKPFTPTALARKVRAALEEV